MDSAFTSASLTSFTSDNTWTTWCADSSTSGTNIDCIWSNWASGTADSSSVTVSADDATAWNIWAGEESSVVQPAQNVIVSIPPPPDPEAEAERERRAEERRREAEEKECQRQAAKETAKQLLEECLTEDQLEMFREMGCFLVISQSGRIYRIRQGRVQNIDEVDQDHKRIATWCAHPSDRVPDYDTMLAQKLYLETAEEEFLQVAKAS